MQGIQYENGGMQLAQNTAGLTDMDLLFQGKAPETVDMLRLITVGVDTLISFLKKQYLEEYIPEGGSKIKFVTGRPGSGKTHFARLLEAEASNAGYLTVSFSAKKVWLHDFREIYLEILQQCRIERVLKGCADRIVESLGQDPDMIPEGKTYLDTLSERGEADALSKGEIRSALRTFFTRNPLLDNSFAASCSLLTGDLLGHPVLESANRELLLSYLYGDKTAKLSQLRALGLSPSRITKFNARHLLRSLAEVVRLAGYKGILVTIDDMETLLNRSSGEIIRYTKLRRDDAYENIRQLIDDIDSMRSVWFLFCCGRELLENENYGLKSYQALWMRIQNEIVSTRFNQFADMIDLDRYADERYTPQVLVEMGRKLSDGLIRAGAIPEAVPSFDTEMTGKLMERSAYGGIGLPYLVNRAVTEPDRIPGSDDNSLFGEEGRGGAENE